MRLFLCCNRCRRKIYLASNAKTRKELARQWTTSFNMHCPSCRYKTTYYVNSVFAERSVQNNSLSVAAIGGLVGLIGGPVGVLAGGAIGGLLGKNIDDSDYRAVIRFNNSRV